MGPLIFQHTECESADHDSGSSLTSNSSFAGVEVVDASSSLHFTGEFFVLTLASASRSGLACGKDPEEASDSSLGS